MTAPPPRFALRYDTASATYTLQLKDVQRSDEGRYECQIIVGINNKVTTFQRYNPDSRRLGEGVQPDEV